MAKRVVNCAQVPLGFPTTDPIALDLLCLMAGYNDLIALAEWAPYDKELADYPPESYIGIGRQFVKLRFIVSVFYEVLLVLERLEQEPGRATLRFDRPGDLDASKYRADPPPDVTGLEVTEDDTANSRS